MSRIAFCQEHRRQTLECPYDSLEVRQLPLVGKRLLEQYMGACKLTTAGGDTAKNITSASESVKMRVAVRQLQAFAANRLGVSVVPVLTQRVPEACQRDHLPGPVARPAQPFERFLVMDASGGAIAHVAGAVACQERTNSQSSLVANLLRHTRAL